MSRAHPTILFVAAICAGLFGFAFVAAPNACDWGLVAYCCSGAAVILALLAAPFVLQRKRSWWKRVGLAIGLGIIGVGVWVAGMVAANIRIICRLI